MNDNSENIRAVCVGFTNIVGGKLGELWTLEETALRCLTGEALRAASSAFAASKPKPTVGAVYETTGRIENGKLVSIGLDRKYVDMIDTDSMKAAILASRGIEQREAAKRAEEKARKTIPGQRAISDLARIVASARLNDQDAVVLAISTAIRREALNIWKSSPKGGAK